MMTGELKSKIENIWDIFWSSGMTNPLTIVEQITYLLFIKMIDDNEVKKEALAAALEIDVVDPIFDADHQNCRWHIFRHYEADNMYKNMMDNVFPFIKTDLGGGKDTAYAKYLKDALFLIPTARVLVRVVDALDSLDMNNKDIMGDVYEVLLSQMAQSGKNGQFRTPRHITKMIVELAAPTLDDEICDPAMGSAGFLCSAVQYIHDHYASDLMKTENRKKFNTSMFTGFDTDQTMLRIGAMNMMLHGVEEPRISWQDSLSEDNTCRDQFSLILANPPFAGSLDKESISKDLLVTTNTTKTELLFMSLFVHMLKVGGKCLSIVPQGVLSNDSTAHLSLRKELVENQRLEAVISLPSGVFHPYSGVATAILIFTKTNHGGTDKVWFYQMRADGLSLDPHRVPVAENDIPDIIARFRNPEGENARERTEQSFFVSKDEIVEKNYTFSFGRYSAVVKDDTDAEPFEEKMARLTDELSDLFAQSHVLEEEIRQKLGAIGYDI
ncbi:MAG: N-6 DNA methylase [Christensenellales bacterium]